MKKKKPDFKSYCLHFFKYDDGTIHDKDGGRYVELGFGRIIALIITLVVILLVVFLTDRSTVISLLLCLFNVLMLGPLRYFFTGFEEVKAEKEDSTPPPQQQ